jgi:serine/threonine protein kinase
MSSASELKRCPKCDSPIPAEAPQGLCPQCLLLQASLPTEAGADSPPKSPAPTLEELAHAFPQLEILGLIGQGGMGFVFKARQPKLERFVALKILPQSLAADPAFAERFTREGRALARLNHPNIVTIHDFGEANGFFYLLMEYVDGVNLRQAMKVGRFTPDQALAIVPKICDALQFAHNEGILHRDIKPENILLDTKGRVKIADFGIAKITGTENIRTGGGGLQPPDAHNATGLIGTPQYMAPEQIEHPKQTDQRADVYSLGVVFYEMLTGELPLGRFAPPSEKSAADPRLDEVVLRALEKEPKRRTQSAGEIKTQIETIASTATPKDCEEEKSNIRRSVNDGIGSRSRTLNAVALLFLAYGFAGFWIFAAHTFRGYTAASFLLLGVPIGIGLLRRRPWWRLAALAALGISAANLI